ncbi:MAG: hypothetical protein WCW61_03485 [Patescibacteria group bacterium]
MPVLTFCGLPEITDPVELEEFSATLAKIIAYRVPELRIKASDISIYFPHDLSMKSGKEIIIFVDGLVDKPERTEEVRKKMAEVIAETTSAAFPKANLVECFIRPFNPEQGFHSWRK